MNAYNFVHSFGNDVGNIISKSNMKNIPVCSIVIKIESFQQRRGHQVKLEVITYGSFLISKIFPD